VTRWARLAAALGFLGIAAIAHGEHQGQDADHRTGIRPSDVRSCPASHPIKGNFTPHSAERCIYHAPGWEFYDATHPERCYATEGEARQDGCRRSFRR
jgi:hypothetical protein